MQDQSGHYIRSPINKIFKINLICKKLLINWIITKKLDKKFYPMVTVILLNFDFWKKKLNLIIKLSFFSGDRTGVQVGDPKDCLRVFWSNSSRNGHFDTSSFTSFSMNSPKSGSSFSQDKSSFPKIDHCRIRFIGAVDEVIQVSLFKYRLG